MTAIATGPSTSRIVRSSALSALTIGFAAAFLHDGYRGYAADNVRQFLNSIGQGAEKVSFDPTLTTDRGRAIASQFRPGDPVSSVEAALGRPHLVVDATSYYLARGGRIELRQNANRVTELAWFDAPHSEMDQTWQRWIGYVLAAAGVVFSVRLVRVLTDRVVVDDRGLRVGRSEFIAYADVVGVDTTQLEPDGISVVNYDRNGQRRSLRLDSFDYKKLPVVLDALRVRIKANEDARKQGSPPTAADAPAFITSGVSGSV